MADPSPDARAETAAKVATKFEHRELSEAERRIAEDIFRALVKDAEVRVREALSANLKASPDVPHEVAVSLARDVDSVALPILKFSEVLTEEDLISIVKGHNDAKQVAIAQRSKVSPGVADALIDTGNETAVARLVSNQGAELSDQALDRVLTSYSDSEAVSDSLARRPNLPPALSERLVNAITERLETVLSANNDLPGDAISNLLLQTRERATVSLLNNDANNADLERLVEQMRVSGRLTSSVILRALSMGDVAFFEMALAQMAKIPVQNARILIHDQGHLGFKSLYERAGLPERLFPAFRAGVDVVDETDYDGGPNDRERYMSRVVERMLTQFADSDDQVSDDDIEYLMHKLTQLAA
jgi:uncharacterized protein (DUF2336 family)